MQTQDPTTENSLFRPGLNLESTEVEIDPPESGGGTGGAQPAPTPPEEEEKEEAQP